MRFSNVDCETDTNATHRLFDAFEAKLSHVWVSDRWLRKFNSIGLNMSIIEWATHFSEVFWDVVNINTFSPHPGIVIPDKEESRARALNSHLRASIQSESASQGEDLSCLNGKEENVC